MTPLVGYCILLRVIQIDSAVNSPDSGTG